MRAFPCVLGSALLALAFLAGCGGEAHDATSKELAALTAEISKLRADQAAIDERLEALEHGKAPPGARSDAAPEGLADPPAASARSIDSDRPVLDVVRLGPSPDEDGADTEADGPRTVLRSGANGIVVEEQNANGTTRTVTTTDAGPKKVAPAKKADKPAPKKTASNPKP